MTNRVAKMDRMLVQGRVLDLGKTEFYVGGDRPRAVLLGLVLCFPNSARSGARLGIQVTERFGEEIQNMFNESAQPLPPANPVMEFFHKIRRPKSFLNLGVLVLMLGLVLSSRQDGAAESG